MAAKRWARGSLAGVGLNIDEDPVKCRILDGANLQARRHVNQRSSADGTVFTQGVDLGGRGARFGLNFAFLPVDLFTSIIANINAALDNQDTFSIEVEDDFQVASGDCTVDGTGWLSYPDQDTNEQVVENVTMRFITQ